MSCNNSKHILILLDINKITQLVWFSKIWSEIGLWLVYWREAVKMIDWVRHLFNISLKLHSFSWLPFSMNICNKFCLQRFCLDSMKVKLEHKVWTCKRICFLLQLGIRDDLANFNNFTFKFLVNFDSVNILKKWKLSELTNRWNFEYLHDCLCVFYLFQIIISKTTRFFCFGYVDLTALYDFQKSFLMDLGRNFWMISSPKFPQYIKESSGWFAWFLRVMCWEVVLRHFKHSEKKHIAGY